MYRLEIIAGRTGIDFDHLIWKMFQLTPCSQTPLTVTYTAKSSAPLSKYQSDVLQGWIEEGDIIGYVCEMVEE